MKIVLEVGSINYSKLGKFLSTKTSGLKSLGIGALFTGLEFLDSDDAENAIVNGSDLFKEALLNKINNAAGNYGVEFSNVIVEQNK